MFRLLMLRCWELMVDTKYCYSL